MAKHSSDNQSAKRVLRIGIIQAGKIVEERIIRQRKTVTLGSSARNTIVVPGLPRSFAMFPHKKGKYRLRFAHTADGRVSQQGQVLTMAQVRQQGICSVQGDCQELPLDQSTRGKVQLGEVTVLFQFVTPPPVRPRPQLPHYIRGSFFRAVDPVLACSLVVMAVANFGFAAFLHTLEFPPEMTRVEEVIPWIPIPKKPVILAPSVTAYLGEKPVKVVQVEKPAKAKSKANSKSKRKSKATRPSRSAACDAACKADKKRKRLERLVRKYGALSAIGHKNGKKPGYMKDLLKPGNPGAELAKAIPSGGVRVASRDNAFALNRQKTNDGPGKVTRVGDLARRITGPSEVKLKRMVKDRIPTVVLRKAPLKVDDGMNHNAAYWAIKRTLSCIEAGYLRTLKHNPTAEGKMAVCLRVNEAGKVASMTTKTDTVGDPTFARRVKGCLLRISFPPPKNKTARICVPLVLKRAYH